MITPLYFADGSKVDRCIVGEGSEIYGEVYNSVIGSGVVIEEGTVVRDSIIMSGTRIGRNCTIDKAIVAENVAAVSYTHLDVYKRQIYWLHRWECPGHRSEKLYRNFVMKKDWI